MQKEAKITKFKGNSGKWGTWRRKEGQKGAGRRFGGVLGSKKGAEDRPPSVRKVSVKCSPSIRKVSSKAPGGMRGGPGAS